MTAVGVESQITEALLTRLGTLTFSPTLPVAYPNVTFTPPTSGPYLHAHAPLRAATQAVGISAWDEHAGIFQVDVVYRAQDGVVKPTQIADAVAAHFPRNLHLANGSVRVDINEPPSIAGPVTDGTNLKTPVSIRYRCFKR
jgi:hypothetical protein